MNKKYPHIISHAEVSIRDATDDDYYRPAALIHCCKVIDIRITEKLCNLISCNSQKEMGTCSPKEEASFYRVGDDSFDIQCQPACFNIIPKNNPKEITTDMPHLNFHKNECIILPPTVAYCEKPYYRSNNHFERRLNDMPTGFSREPDPTSTIGWKYKFNETYCEYFDEKLLDNGNCGLAWYNTIGDFLGLGFLKQINSSINVLFTDKPFDIPTNLPPLPTQIPNEYTLSGWKSNINEKFKIPEIIDTTPQAIKTVLHAKHSLEQQHQIFKKMNKKPVKSIGTDFQNMIEDALNDMNFIEKLIAIFGVNHLAQEALEGVKSYCIKLIEKLGPIVGKEMLLLTESFGSKVLTEALSIACVNSAIRFSLMSVTTSALFLSKLAISAASVIGWILIIGVFVDLIFQFWDPFGYKNILPLESLDLFVHYGEQILRNQLNTDNPIFTFEMLASKLLTQDELMELNIGTFRDSLTYLNSLTVNSEGKFIDHGDEIIINGDLQSFSDAYSRAHAKHLRFNLTNYNKFNESFEQQAKLNNKLSISGILCGIFASVLYVFKLNVLAFMMIIIMIVSFIMARYDLISSHLTEAFKELKYTI